MLPHDGWLCLLTFNLIHDFVGRQGRPIQLVHKGKEGKLAHTTDFKQFARLWFQSLGSVQQHELYIYNSGNGDKEEQNDSKSEIVVCLALFFAFVDVAALARMPTSRGRCSCQLTALSAAARAR